MSKSLRLTAELVLYGKFCTVRLAISHFTDYINHIFVNNMVSFYIVLPLFIYCCYLQLVIYNLCMFICIVYLEESW